ncbi:MAG: multiheme c-type cytochrome [Planctomycetota bacterium]
MFTRKSLLTAASASLAIAVLVVLAPAAAPPKAEQPGGDSPPPYLIDEADIAAVAQKYGLDEEAAERLERAHHHLVEHQSKPKPDPVEANGEVFEDWPTPDAAIVFTGEQIGYLEPCGCAGLENQKGGLKRRHTMVRTLREKWGWPLALFDAGEQVRYFGPQANIKHRHSIEALIDIGYQAVGFGVKDLRTELLGLAINLDETTNPLTSANVGVLGFDSGFTQRWRVLELAPGNAGGRPTKIGVTQVIGEEALAEVAPNDDLLTMPPVEALSELMPRIKADRCDQNVLMVYGNVEEAKALARRFDIFDWVVAARGADEPPHMSRKVDGTTRGGGTMLIEVGHKGMYAVVVGLYRVGGGEPGEGWQARYQKTPLDHRWIDSPQMHARLVNYQEELEQLRWDGLGLAPTTHPTERDFAGSAVCGDCHTSAWEVFEQTPHFHTTETLVALEPARHFDPECIACHATGWEPQKYFPFASGWKSFRETPEMHGQGCENCHGPAARHTAVEYGDIEVDEAEQAKLRQALHLEIGANEGNMKGQQLGRAVNNCLGCHDLDNSPDFDFQEYWPEVAHEGMD